VLFAVGPRRPGKGWQWLSGTLCWPVVPWVWGAVPFLGPVPESPVRALIGSAYLFFLPLALLLVVGALAMSVLVQPPY
jgi:hypothetical protein